MTIQGFLVRQSVGAGIYVTSGGSRHGRRQRRLGGRQAGERSDEPGIKLSGATASTVIRNVTHDNSDHGIFLTSGSQGNVVTGNESFGNARGVSRAAEGIFLRGAPATSSRRIGRHDNEDSGIGLWNGANNTLVANNSVFRNGDHGIDTLSSTGERSSPTPCTGTSTPASRCSGSAGRRLTNNISVDNGINSPRTGGNIRVVDSGSASRTTLDYDLVFLTSGTDPDRLPRDEVLVARRVPARRPARSRTGARATRRGSALRPATSTCAPGSPAIDSATSAVAVEPDARRGRPRTSGRSGHREHRHRSTHL